MHEPSCEMLEYVLLTHGVRFGDLTEFGRNVLEAIEGLKCQMLQEVRGRRFGMAREWSK